MSVFFSILASAAMIALLVGGPYLLARTCILRYPAAGVRERSVYRVLIGSAVVIGLYNLVLILGGGPEDMSRALSWAATLSWIALWSWAGLVLLGRRRRSSGTAGTGPSLR